MNRARNRGMNANEHTASMTAATASRAPPFDVCNFDALSEMIGEDGAREMVNIFETETRGRLRRLTAGEQSLATLVREMHTLKGAADTVASPRLAELGRMLESAAGRGVVPSPDHISAIGSALEAFLIAARARNESRCALA